MDVMIEVVSISPARIRVEGRKAEGTTAWSFRNFYGSADGLAERIENLSLSDEGGVEVAVRKLAPGEFTAAKAATHFSYDLKLDPPAFISDSSHVSWLTTDRGLLMPGDILPLPLTDAKVELALPAGWSVSTVETKNGKGVFDVTDAERAVFFVGRDLKNRNGRVGGMKFTLAMTGIWAFGDEEAEDSVRNILKIYEEMIGAAPQQPSMLVLLPPPQSASAGNLWNAETRGSTVVLVSGRLPSKLAALAQLDGSLSHELLHLWIPNGLALDGEYDWFYEGFTNYQALRVGMRRGQLTFQDYLNALGQAFDAYKSARGAKEISLVEASKRRWPNSTSLIYHKGMLVALLYDLTLMRHTGGKSSLGDVYRELFRLHGKGGKREDGNRAVIELLSGMPGMRDFVERYVAGDAEITLGPLIEPFGLRIEPGGARTHIGVAASLDRRQQESLRKLGYNGTSDSEARKLHEQLKRRPPR
jgi:predicted metalloprotease with PDZ domain